MQKIESIVKWGAIAAAVLIVGLFVWSSAQPDPETQEFLDKMDQIGR